jgi:hypothetical protein
VKSKADCLHGTCSSCSGFYSTMEPYGRGRVELTPPVGGLVFRQKKKRKFARDMYMDVFLWYGGHVPARGAYAGLNLAAPKEIMSDARQSGFDP